MRNVLRVSSLLVAATSLVGCTPRKGTANPEDYIAVIQHSLEGGRVAAMISRNQAIQAGDFAGCVAGEIMSSALKSGEKALAGSFSDAPVIPAFETDLSDCMKLRGALPPGNTDMGLVEDISGAALTAARYYAGRLKIADCRKGTAMMAIVDYMMGMDALVAAELAKPDGIFSVGDVPINLALCKAP